MFEDAVDSGEVVGCEAGERRVPAEGAGVVGVAVDVCAVEDGRGEEAGGFEGWHVGGDGRWDGDGEGGFGGCQGQEEEGDEDE